MLDFLPKFIQFCKLEKNLSKNTISSYRSDILDFLQFSKSDKIVENIQNYSIDLSKRGQKATSINRKISAISQFMRFLFENKYIDENPIKSIKKPKNEKKIPDFLSSSEVEKLIKGAIEFDIKNGIRNACIISLLYASGGRVSEVCGLKFSSFEFLNLEKTRIKQAVRLFGKGGKERICPIDKNTVLVLQDYFELLAKHEQKGQYIFESKLGKPISRVYVGLMLKKIARFCGFDEGKVHPHTMRHSIAIKLLEGGMDIRVLQEFLGHRDISTTAIYTHINKSEVIKLVENYHPMGKL